MGAPACMEHESNPNWLTETSHFTVQQVHDLSAFLVIDAAAVN